MKAEFADGSSELIWSTFSSEQIDLDCSQPKVKEFIRKNLEFLAKHGAGLIRLDAFGYATKKPGTSCFFLEPEVWDLLKGNSGYDGAVWIKALPEIHDIFYPVKAGCQRI